VLRRTGHVLVLLAGLTALVLVVRHIGAATIAAMIRQVGWSMAPIILLYALHTALRGVALWQTLPTRRIPLRRVVRIRFCAEGLEMVTLTGPFVAEPAKAWLLYRHGLAGAQALGAVAAEYLLYNLSAAWMAAAALSILVSRRVLPPVLNVPAQIMLIGVAVLTVGCIIAGLTGRGLVAPSVRAVSRLVAPRHTDALVSRVEPSEAVLVSVLHDDPRRLAAVLGVEFAGHALLAFEIAVALGALGLPAGLFSAFVIEGAVKCIGALFFFVPGQVGVAEGVYALLLPVMGLPAAAGVTIALIRRVRALAVGAAGLLIAGSSRATDQPQPERDRHG